MRRLGMLIKTRMSLAIALLSLGFIFFAASVFWAHWKEVQGANSLLSASQYLERATAVAHELQKERGFSVGLMSGAEKFKPLLHAQRQDTQTQLEALTAFVASKEGAELPVDLQQLYQRFLNGLQNRQSWQERVDAGSTTPAQMVVYYSELIALLQDGVAHLLSLNPNPSLTPVLMALQDVLEMKERAGVERAVASGVLASGAVTDAALMRLSGLIELQKQSWAHFQLYAPKPLTDAVRELMSDASIREVENIRQQLMARSIKVSAPEWFAVATERIEQLRKAKDVLATHLVSATIDYRDNLFSQFVWQLLLAVVFIVLALSVFALAMYRLGNGLDLLVDTMVGSAKTKDLSLKAHYPFPDEVGQVAKAFNQMTSDFAMLVEKIRDISTQLASAAEQTSVTTASSAKELSSQMGHMLSVTSAVEELSTSVAEVSTQVQSLDEAITQMHAESTAAEKAVAASVADIHHLNTEVLHINEGVSQLSQNSERITEVVSVIRTIAGQTNLLALNAAIEAARAGEAGRGFAVVADEVRSLAQRTQESTLEIEEMITALQSSVTETSNLISSSQKTVAHSVDLSQTVSDSLGAIFDAIQKTRDLTSQISAASQEEAVASSEVARSAAEVGNSTEYAVENAKQIALVSNDLSKLAAQMAQAANLFRTS